MSNYDFNNFQQDALTKPRDKAWDNWAKFEKVGDSVQGYIRDVFFRESEGDFKEQRGITLEQPSGELINVGIKYVDFVLAKTNALRLGDPLTVVFEKEIPSQTKGYSPVKQFGFYGKNLPENAGNKTVEELEQIDMGEAKEEKAAAEAKANADFDGTGTGAAPVAAATPSTSTPVASAESFKGPESEAAAPAAATEEAPKTEGGTAQ